MDATPGNFSDSFYDSFSVDEPPFLDAQFISGCEEDLAEAQNMRHEGLMKEYIMRLTCALVHSKIPGNIHRGIAMLESLVINGKIPMKLREKLYFLAVGYYRSRDFLRSRSNIDRCLEVEPEWRKARALKKAIEDGIVKDVPTGVGIAVAAVGIVTGIVAALVLRG